MADAALDEELVAVLPKLRWFAFGLAGFVDQATTWSRPPTSRRWHGATSASRTCGW